MEGVEGPEFQTAAARGEQQVLRVGEAEGKHALGVCDWDFTYLSEKWLVEVRGFKGTCSLSFPPVVCPLYFHCCSRLRSLSQFQCFYVRILFLLVIYFV